MAQQPRNVSHVGVELDETAGDIPTPRMLGPARAGRRGLPGVMAEQTQRPGCGTVQSLSELILDHRQSR